MLLPMVKCAMTLLDKLKIVIIAESPCQTSIYKYHTEYIRSVYPGKTGHEAGIYAGEDSGPSHTLTTWGNSESPIHLLVCFEEVGGNQKTQRKPTGTQRETSKMICKVTIKKNNSITVMTSCV